MCACNWNFNCIINNTPLWLVNDLALEQTRIRTYMHAIRVITHTHRGRQSTSASEANMQTQITLLDNNLGHLALQNVICVGVIKFPDKCAWWLVTRQLQITSTWLASLHSHVQRPGSWEWLQGNRWPRPKPTESFSSFPVGVVTAHWRKLNTNVPGNVKSESLLK